MPDLELAYQRLALALARLEADANAGRFNPLCLRDFAETALLLGAEDLSARAVTLLRRAPDSAFTAGLMTNAKLPADFADRMRILPPLAELDRCHPRHDRDAFLTQLRADSDPNGYIGLALAGRIDDAVRVAGRGLALEETGITLAVLRRFPEAFEVARNPNLESFRQSNIRFVAVIELFLAGRVEEADRLLGELAPAGFDPWAEVQLARGLAGREPWGGYPFPDW